MVSVSRTAAWTGVLTLLASVDAHASTQDLIAYSRIAERLLVGLAGALSLWMGYRLFRVVGETKAPGAAADTTRPPGGGIEGNIGEFVRLKMWDVGPGLFFALFGSGLLAYVLFSQVEIKLPPEGSKPETIVKWNIPGLTPEQGSQKVTTVVRSIRTLQDINLSGDASQEAKVRQATAIENLVQSIPQLVDVGFGESAYAVYEKLLVMTPAEREKASEVDRKKFESVNAALNGKV